MPISHIKNPKVRKPLTAVFWVISSAVLVPFAFFSPCIDAASEAAQDLWGAAKVAWRGE